MSESVLSQIARGPDTSQVAGPDLGKMLSLRAFMQQTQEHQQEVQRQNTLRQILGTPGAIDPKTGTPTERTMGAVMAVDPNTGMKLQQNVLAMQTQRAQLQEHQEKAQKAQLDRYGEIQDIIHPIRTQALAAYQAALPQGQEAANKAGQAVLDEQIPGVINGGQLTPDEAKQVRTKFDFPTMSSTDAQWQAMQAKQRDEQRKDVKLGLDIRKADQGTPAVRADQDAMTIANAKISDTNKNLAADGKPPLNPAEEASIRQQARMAPKVDQAAQTAAATTESRMKGQEVPQKGVDLAVDRFLSGDKAALTGFGRTQGIQRQIITTLGDRAEAAGMNGADISAKIAEYAGAISGSQTIGRRMATIYYAERAVQRMAPLALQSSEQLNRTKYPTLNSIEQAIEKGTGDPDIITFNTRNQALITEYGKFLDPNGGGTDTTRATAKNMLETSYNKGQYQAAVNAMLTEIESGHTAAQLAIQDVTAGIAGKTVQEPPPQQPVTISPSGAKSTTAAPTGGAPKPDASGKYDLSKAGHDDMETVIKALPAGAVFVGPDGKTYRKP